LGQNIILIIQSLHQIKAIQKDSRNIFFIKVNTTWANQSFDAAQVRPWEGVMLYVLRRY